MSVSKWTLWFFWNVPSAPAGCPARGSRTTYPYSTYALCLGRPWDPTGAAWRTPVQPNHTPPPADPTLSRRTLAPACLRSLRASGQPPDAPQFPNGLFLCYTWYSGTPADRRGAECAAIAAMAPPSPCWEFKSQQERFERRTSRGNCTEAIFSERYLGFKMMAPPLCINFIGSNRYISCGLGDLSWCEGIWD